jgi:hypothetical protein
LDEIDLGPFEIRLHWDRIGDRRPYEVVALEPNPSGESRDGAPARQGGPTLRRRGQGIDRSGPANRTALGLLPHREPDPRHVQLRQRLRRIV